MNGNERSKELHTHDRNDTSDVVTKPNCRESIPSECILKPKRNAECIAKQCSPGVGICGNKMNEDSTNIFALVVYFTKNC